MAAFSAALPLPVALAATTEGTASEPTQTEVPTTKLPPEPEQPREREGPYRPEGPVPGTPFTPVTPPGDPFGLTPYTGLAAGIPTGAAGIRLGPAIIYPTIGVAALYDDNIFATKTNKKGSTGTILTPAIRAELRGRGGNVYALTASTDMIRYSDSNADNYDSIQLRGDSLLIITTRARLKIDAQYTESVDRRGSTTRAVGAEPDRWNAKRGAGLFSYGAPGARGRIDVEAGYGQQEYLTNRSVTAAFDHDTTYAGGAFYWRVMPKTSLLIQARQTSITYDQATPNLDSTERLVAIGATWEATAQTTGVLRIGQLRKEFDAPEREGYTGLTWEGTVRWSPRTYSSVEFTTAQHTTETTGLGDYTLSRVGFATWTHAWTSRTTSLARVGYRNDEYRGSGTTRDDDTLTGGLSLHYQFRRWLRFDGRYDHIRRTSSDTLSDYNRNIFMFTINANL
jgi:hypothetical protein